VRSVEFSPDDAFILTAGVDATAKLWDASNGEMLDTIAEHSTQMPAWPFQAADFSPDGRWVITGSIDGVIRTWAVGSESRSVQQIDRLLRCRVPWQIGDETLVPRSPEPALCFLLAPSA
jgi:WD40 repeat protein